MGMVNGSQEMPSWMEGKMLWPHLAKSLPPYKGYFTKWQGDLKWGKGVICNSEKQEKN